MRRWFASLRLHRKIVAIVLAVSTVAVGAAVIGLLAFDVARFRTGTIDEAETLGRVIARNSAAAILFNDAEAAREILESVDVRPLVSRACVYTADGTLLAAYEPSPVMHCPSVPSPARDWTAVSVAVPVSRNDRVVGTVYIERTLTDLPARIIVTAVAALLMLLIAAGLAFALASRLQQLVSRPIVSLARAARSIGGDQIQFPMPDIDAAPDETGELVRSFREMVQRLLSANEALKAEVKERTRMQAEREQLLTREREASRLKDEFLAAVSHELRTPLNAILGWTQLLEATPATRQTVAQAIESIGRNARAQNRVIEDLLDISRVVTGKLQLRLTAVDIRTVVQAAIEVTASAAEAKQIRIDVTMPSAPCLVQGDVDRLRQAFWNLLSNAIKFTPPGGAVMVVVADRDDGVRVTIVDTGIGISPDFAPHLFERFRQADGSIARQHGGLGLGLAIVKELVELHSGTVHADSPGIGKGSTFEVSLPHPIGPVQHAQPGERGAVLSSARLEGVDVLVIDDSPDAVDVLVSILTSAGATVRGYCSAIDAVEAIHREPPDIVLCDIAMPGMDGFETLRLIRASEPAEASMVPALAVTAYASTLDRDKCLRAGFEGCVTKPFDAADLIHRIAETLERV